MAAVGSNITLENIGLWVDSRHHIFSTLNVRYQNRLPITGKSALGPILLKNSPTEFCRQHL